MLHYGIWYGVGIFVAGLEQVQMLGPLLLLLVLGGYGGHAYLSREPLQRGLLCALCLALGGANALWHQHVPARHGVQRLATTEVKQVQGLVVSETTHRTPQRSAFTLALQHCGDQPCEGKVQVFLAQAQTPVYGQQLTLQGRLDRPAQADNFGGFSYAQYLATQGIHGVFYARELRSGKVFAGPLGVYGVLRQCQRLRQQLLSAFEAHLPLGSARILGSLILGEKVSPVPEALQGKFQQLGLQHVLAVSGYQVQLLVLCVVLGLRALRCSRLMQMGLAIVALWGFVLLTGAPASVLRAAAVATWVCGAQAFFYKLSLRGALCAGILLLLGVNPLLLWDVGFQFSALATLGLMCNAQRFQQAFGFLPVSLGAMISAVLAAQLWVLPLQLFHFGTLAWLFLPGNLWAGLWTTLLTWAAMAAALASMLLWGWPLQALFWAIGLCVQALLGGMELLLYLPQPVLYFPRLSPTAVILAYALLGLYTCNQATLSPRWRQPLKAGILAMLLCLPALKAVALWQDQRQCPLRVTYLSVGQGDASLLEVGGQAILVDAGPSWKTDTGFDDAGRRSIVPYLRQRGIRQLHTVVLSHGHLDHYGGLASIAAVIPVQRLLVPEGLLAAEKDAGALAFTLKLLKAQGTRIETVNTGSLRSLPGDVRLLFWQPLGPEAGHNDSSLVMQVEHQNVRFLFAGDLEHAGEAALLHTEGFVPRTDILKVPHHGSSTSSTPEFLQALSPRDAVVSVGERNRFRHPSPKVMDRYAQYQSRVWRTDQQGAVCVCSTGVGYTIQAKKVLN